MDGHRDLVRATLDLNPRDAGFAVFSFNGFTNGQVFMQELGVTLFIIPFRLPILDDAQPKPYRVNLVPHLFLRHHHGNVT